MRYPIGVQDFEKIIEGNYVYVDKTDLVYELTKENVCFLSRPRRFGKSLLISTLDAYFKGKKELFEGLKIADLEKEWVEYPVFKIDFAAGKFGEPNVLNNILEEYINQWESIYGRNPYGNELEYRFKYVLEQAEKKTGHKAVVLIDEYDKPLLDPLGEEQE
ncbi:MAG: AAA family ATPase, partial [Selenomonadales bacterium]|nr:AAA family ATPase [Selenomonadales bacterium]